MLIEKIGRFTCSIYNFTNKVKIFLSSLHIHAYSRNVLNWRYSVFGALCSRSVLFQIQEKAKGYLYLSGSKFSHQRSATGSDNGRDHTAECMLVWLEEFCDERCEYRFLKSDHTNSTQSCWKTKFKSVQEKFELRISSHGNVINLLFERA